MTASQVFHVPFNLEDQFGLVLNWWGQEPGITVEPRQAELCIVLRDWGRWSEMRG